MTKMLSLLLAAPASVNLLSITLVMAGGVAVVSLEAWTTGEVPWGLLVMYMVMGLSLLPSTLLQAVAAWQVWHDRGWVLALVASILGIGNSLLCCNPLALGCAIGSLVLIFHEDVRHTLRKEDLA